MSLRIASPDVTGRSSMDVRSHPGTQNVIPANAGIQKGCSG